MADTKPIRNDCFLSDAARMRHDEVLARIRAQVRGVRDRIKVPLKRACGRVCLETITAPRAVPAHRNSAVDGYAFAHDEYIRHKGHLTLAGRIQAGDAPGVRLDAAHGARIFTGAPMPGNADTVAMQEDVTIAGGDTTQISIPAGLKQGANVRQAGEDLRFGAPIVASGQRLRAQDVAALASGGVAEIACAAPLRIALVSTGNEIVRPGRAITAAQGYDSNHYLLRGLLQGFRARITDYGILPDNAEATQNALLRASAHHDVIITTGGASRGDEDHIVTALDRCGTRHLWQLAVKPGRPMSLGHMGSCAFLALPGNPVAVMVCFLLYGRPVLQALEGENWREPRRFAVIADFDMAHKKPDRREFLRGILRTGDDGRTWVRNYPHSGSGLISSLRGADGLIELTEPLTSVQRGQTVPFIAFSAFGLLA